MSWFTQIRTKLSSQQESGIKGLIENVFSLSVLQGINYLLPLITLPYLVRVLGAEKFGVVAFAQATMQYFIIFTDYGFNLSATRNIAAHQQDNRKISEIFSTVLTVRFVLMIVGFFLLLLLVKLVGKFAAEPTLFLISYGLVVGNVLFPVWFFQGIEKMTYSTVMILIARLLFVVLIFIFVRSTEDYLYVPLLNSLGFIIAGILSMIIAVRKFRVSFGWFGWRAITSQFKSSFQFFLSQISGTVYSSFNTIILGFFTNNQTVGYYAAAEKLFIAMRSAFYPLVQALYPYMASKRNVALFKKIFRYALLGALAIAVVVFSLSSLITNVVFGADFAASAGILRLFALLIPVIAASLLLSYPLLAALNHEKYANYSNVIGALIHVALIAALIPVISSHVVVIVMMISESLILGMRIYGVRKHHLWQT